MSWSKIKFFGLHVNLLETSETYHQTSYQEAGTANSRHKTNLLYENVSIKVLCQCQVYLFGSGTWVQIPEYNNDPIDLSCNATQTSSQAQTSYSFFWRPLDSIGKRLNMTNNLKWIEKFSNFV